MDSQILYWCIYIYLLFINIKPFFFELVCNFLRCNRAEELITLPCLFSKPARNILYPFSQFLCIPFQFCNLSSLLPHLPPAPYLQDLLHRPLVLSSSFPPLISPQ